MIYYIEQYDQLEQTCIIGYLKDRYACYNYCYKIMVQDESYKTPAKRTTKTGWDTSLKSSPIAFKFNTSPREPLYDKLLRNTSPGPIYNIPSTLQVGHKYKRSKSADFTTFGRAKKKFEFKSMYCYQ